MRVLIIGAAGLVGNSCYEVLVNHQDLDVVGTYRNYQSEAYNFTHFNPLEEAGVLLLSEKWDVIIHTGALTNVDLCELEPQKSYDETVLSTNIILDEVVKHNPEVHFIYISTDYVFDGISGPYDERSTTNPINVYGKHKLAAEILVNEKIKLNTIVRVTNVYGNEERNKNFVSRLLIQIKQNADAKINASVDQFATPINAIDIARIIELVIYKKASGIIHAAGYDYYNRYQLLLKVLSYIPHHTISVVPIITSEMKQAAKRPLKGGLLNTEVYKLDPNFLFSNIDDFIKKQLNNGI